LLLISEIFVNGFDCPSTGHTNVADCELDFGPTFYLDRSVPADDQVTSLTGVGDDARNGTVAFATTHWSIVLTAQERSPAADAALEKLCRIYWWPLYGFVRRQGYSPEEAQDFTQGFFALLLERRDFDAVRREKGRLRSYLLVSLKNFLGKAHRRSLALKRGDLLFDTTQAPFNIAFYIVA